MELEEAKAECERWFSYHKMQDEMSKALQELAADRRAGRCDDAEMRIRRSNIGSVASVYDGTNLADAVRIILKHVK